MRLLDGRGVARFHGIRDRSTSSLEGDVSLELTALERAGVEQALVVDLSQRELGVSVVRVLVPGLEGIFDVPGYVPRPRARQSSPRWGDDRPLRRTHARRGGRAAPPTRGRGTSRPLRRADVFRACEERGARDRVSSTATSRASQPFGTKGDPLGDEPGRPRLRRGQHGRAARSRTRRLRYGRGRGRFSSDFGAANTNATTR